MAKDPRIEKIIKDAEAQGYSRDMVVSRLETRGIDVSEYKEQKPKKNFLQKTAEFLGIEKAGQATATAFREITGQNKRQINESLNTYLTNGQQLIEQARKLPLGSPERTKLLKMASEQKYISANEIDEGQNLSNREVIGSFGNVAMNMVGGSKVLNKAGTGFKLMKTGQVAEKVAEVAPKVGRIARITRTAVNNASLGAGYGLSGGLEQDKSGDELFKSILTGAGIGVALPTAAGSFKVLGSFASKAAKSIASTYSGMPINAIEHALKNPEAVQRAIQTAVKDGGESTAIKIRDYAVEALENIKKVRREGYRQGLAKLENETMTTKNGQLYVKKALTDPKDLLMKGYKEGDQVWVPTNLSLKGVRKVATSTLKQFGLEIDKNGVINASRKPYLDKKGLQEVYDMVKQWDDLTPKGLDDLRQAINGYRHDLRFDAPTAKKQFNKIVGDIADNVSTYVGDRVPQIKELNTAYRTQSEAIDNILTQLNLESHNPQTAVRKLLNVFNPKSEFYKPVVEELGQKGGRDLMSDIAGLIFSKPTPEGLGKYLTQITSAGFGAGAFLNPVSLAGAGASMIVSSPRVVGETAVRVGKVRRVIQKTAEKEAVQKTGEVIKQVGKKAILNAPKY